MCFGIPTSVRFFRSDRSNVSKSALHQKRNNDFTVANVTDVVRKAQFHLPLLLIELGSSQKKKMGKKGRMLRYNGEGWFIKFFHVRDFIVADNRYKSYQATEERLLEADMGNERMH